MTETSDPKSEPAKDLKGVADDARRGPDGDQAGGEYFKKLGAYLKQERTMQRLQQKTISERVGIDISRVSNVEKGHGAPRLENFGLWLEALSLGPAAFGYRFELFQQGMPLPAHDTENALLDLVRPALAQLFHQAAEALVAQR